MNKNSQCQSTHLCVQRHRGEETGQLGASVRVSACVRVRAHACACVWLCVCMRACVRVCARPMAEA